jgi:hypothetical protein
MSNTKLTQYIHRPNITELGMGNTHETYMLINTDIDLSNMFPPSSEVKVRDLQSGKYYALKSAIGREFRVNQMGELYRDYNVLPGDEIVITKIEKGGAFDICVNVRQYNRIVLLVGSYGVEVVNIKRLEKYAIANQSYKINVTDRGIQNTLIISFKEIRRKRSDSPNYTEFYNVSINKQNLANGTYYLTLGDSSSLAMLPKSEYNVVDFNENILNSSVFTKGVGLFTTELTPFLRPFITAIKSKPFLLLAGISGTGKSRIVRELAFMTCPKELQDEDGTTPSNYCMIEVKPNWHDSSELLGYYSSFNGGGYRFTKFDRFVVKAWLNPDVPFFVCLDEMNLAPVEQYFAEFLSVLETRSRDKEGNVVTGALVDKQYFKDDTKMKEDLGLDGADDWTIKVRSDLVNKGLTLPPNLIVIGTVNMDDTTYQFSRKVIDRAMTIEMNGGELSQMFGNSNSLKYRSDEDVVKLGMLKAPYINADEVIERYQSQAQIIKEKLPEKLEAVNTALKDTPFQVSYRVLNELVIYLGALMDEATAKGESIDDDALSALIDQAMDQITLMKILPRIEGDEDMFRRSGGANVLKTLQSLFSEDSDSYRKLEEMADRLDRTGFTRFWP